jgi:hypothetical protein
MTFLDTWSSNMVLHDKRLKGNGNSSFASNIFDVDETMSLADIFSWIQTYSASIGGLSQLFIMCHGYAGENPYSMLCADVGGFGLQLGTEGLKLTTVNFASSLYNCADMIVIYSCAAADDSMASIDPNADGKNLLGQLATYANCPVIAADRIQYYNIINPGAGGGQIDFGAWEGNVFQFNPDGSYQQLPAAS